MFCFWLWLGPGKRPNAIPTGCNSIIRQLPAHTHTSIILSRNPWGITARHISCCASIAGINQSEICQLRSSTLRLATLSMQRLSHHWMQHFQLSSKHTHMLQTSVKYTPQCNTMQRNAMQCNGFSLGPGTPPTTLVPHTNSNASVTMISNDS